MSLNFKHYLAIAGASEGAGTSDKRYLHADERGSIIAISNASGAVTQINAYDEFGIPQAKMPNGTSGSTATASFGRFGYTGQAWFPEIGLYHYKARTYSPTLGRFLQSDPIGYGDGMNIYDYVGGDPVNKTDPSGLAADDPIVVNGRRTCGLFCILRGIGRIFSGGGGSLRGNTTTSTFGLSSRGGSAPLPITIPRPPVARPAAVAAAAPAARPSNTDKKPTNCDRVASQPGAVLVDFVDASAFAAIGVTGAVGVFYNLKTGSGAFFSTAGGGYGLELGIGLKGGFYRSAADLRGFNFNVNGSYGVSGSANFSKDGRLVGGSVGPGAKAGGSATATYTTFFACDYNGGN